MGVLDFSVFGGIEVRGGMGVLACGFRGVKSSALCRCLCGYVGGSVVRKGVGDKRGLPSGHTLTGGLTVDIVAIRGSCNRLTTRKCVCSIPGDKFCMTSLQSSEVGDRDNLSRGEVCDGGLGLANKGGTCVTSFADGRARRDTFPFSV